MRNLDFQNVILAGDGSQSPAENRNLLDARDSAGLLITGSHVAVDLSFGGTSLNRRFLHAGGDPLNGILGNDDFALGTITTIAGPQFLVLEPANRNWRGIYAFNLKPGRQLVFESPHPLFDGTREEGIDLYVATQAAAFSQAGIHRNNCLIEAGCSGMQTSGDPHWISDMAHTTVSFFQVMHEQTDLIRPDHVFVSVHGMADTSNTEEVSISNGTTTDVVGASRSKTLANLMNAILIDAGDPRRTVSHQEPGENPSLPGGRSSLHLRGKLRPQQLGPLLKP
jgi:hypothetical protein